MFADPNKIINQFDLHAGMSVADLGAGTGALSFAAAEKVKGGDGLRVGKIYSIEVQKELLHRIKKEAEEKHLTNIEIIWANIEKKGGTKLADHSCDAAIISNVFFQVEDRAGFMAETKRILKPEGRVLLVDWADSFSSMGPSQDMVITKETAQALFAKNGFISEKEIDAGSHHYGIIFRKA